MMLPRWILVLALIAWPTGVARAQDGYSEAGYILRAGTVVPGMLLTAVNSDHAGDLVAQVTRDVYDYHQQVLLIPRGSRLIGTYGDQVAIGHDRLVVVWRALQWPDGTSFELPGLNASDAAGTSGLPGEVDNHYGRVFRSAVLMAMFGAGINVANPVPMGGYNEAQRLTPSEELQRQVILEVSSMATEMLRRNMSIQPTIRLDAGERFTVIVNRDILLPAWDESRAWW